MPNDPTTPNAITEHYQTSEKLLAAITLHDGTILPNQEFLLAAQAHVILALVAVVAARP